MSEWFIFFRNAAFFFATLMLVKYYIFLILAPFYPIQETLRRIKVRKFAQERILQGKRSIYHPKVSIIIPAWNEEVGILKTVRSILHNTYKNVEIIIINDGSTDNSDAVVRKFIRDALKAGGGVRRRIPSDILIRKMAGRAML